MEKDEHTDKKLYQYVRLREFTRTKLAEDTNKCYFSNVTKFMGWNQILADRLICNPNRLVPNRLKIALDLSQDQLSHF